MKCQLLDTEWSERETRVFSWKKVPSEENLMTGIFLDQSDSLLGSPVDLGFYNLSNGGSDFFLFISYTVFYLLTSTPAPKKPSY